MPPNTSRASTEPSVGAAHGASPSTSSSSSNFSVGGPCLDVRFSHHSPMLFAAALQDSEVQIWDVRHNSGPVLRYRNLHNSRVYCVRWHPSIPGQFATCSRDQSIKVRNERARVSCYCLQQHRRCTTTWFWHADVPFPALLCDGEGARATHVVMRRAFSEMLLFVRQRRRSGMCPNRSVRLPLWQQPTACTRSHGEVVGSRISWLARAWCLTTRSKSGIPAKSFFRSPLWTATRILSKILPS